MSETIFEGVPQESQPVTSSAPVLPQEVVEFVGEGKKYASVEDALKSVPHAQNHIQKLEAELQQLREEVTKRKTTEELLAELKSGVPHEEKPSAVEIPQDKLIGTVEQIISQREAAKKAEQNVDFVISKMTASFGEKAKEKFITVAQESGLTIQQLNKLSETSPMAVLKLAGLAEAPKEQIPGKISSTVNPASIQSANPAVPSARVPKGASTKDMVAAWKAAGEKIKSQQ